MTNKRITELTALDGDDVADNDVLAIVDVSDTTMAASGTTKKITVAELVTDSALTNKFWPNSSTALTGANLANTDRLAVLDVGTPDVPKYIEADQLAQGSQFSSRYKSLTSERLWLPATSFVAIEGSPTLSTLNTSAAASKTAAFLMDSATTEGITGSFITPASWSTIDLYVWWSNAGAGSGDVAWAMADDTFGDADSTDAHTGYQPSPAAIAAPAQFVIKRSKFNTSARGVTSNEMHRVQILRYGADAADTLGNDIGVLALEIVRAS
jgi:hypothetical protein